jgi:hypothetical protein
MPTAVPDHRKRGFSANLERNSYQPYDIKLQNKVNFDIQPTNPQADIVATERCKYWITDVDLRLKHQGNDTDFPSNDAVLPELYTATVACIHNVDGKCKGMLTPERFNILQRAFEKAKYSGLHDNIHPPPRVLHQNSYASLHTKILLPPNIKAKRSKTHSHGCFPPHYKRPSH